MLSCDLCLYFDPYFSSYGTIPAKSICAGKSISLPPLLLLEESEPRDSGSQFTPLIRGRQADDVKPEAEERIARDKTARTPWTSGATMRIPAV